MLRRIFFRLLAKEPYESHRASGPVEKDRRGRFSLEAAAEELGIDTNFAKTMYARQGKAYPSEEDSIIKKKKNALKGVGGCLYDCKPMLKYGRVNKTKFSTQ